MARGSGLDVDPGGHAFGTRAAEIVSGERGPLPGACFASGNKRSHRSARASIDQPAVSSGLVFRFSGPIRADSHHAASWTANHVRHAGGDFRAHTDARGEL